MRSEALAHVRNALTQPISRQRGTGIRQPARNGSATDTDETRSGGRSRSRNPGRAFREHPAIRRIGALATLAAALVAPALSAAAPDCRDLIFEENTYTICTLRADRDDIRLWHSSPDGQLYGSFQAIDEALAAEGRRLAFAMNAGMYHDDRRPVGLYLENGTQSGPLVTREGPGNFGLLPNGIFCIGDRTAAVVESRAYAENPPDCRYASQSGPMLVIDGKLHPRFIPDSDSRYIRNGVGVGADGITVHFAISDNRVNFYSFGRLFRDLLKTPNALYFDGKVSRLHAPALGRSDMGFPLGPIVGATEAAE